MILEGKPHEVFEKLCFRYQVAAVYTNRDYEPYARERDTRVRQILQQKGVEFFDFKDQAIFDCEQVLKPDGKPYTVFTPYMKKWKARLAGEKIPSFETKPFFQNFFELPPYPHPPIEGLGFRHTHTSFPAREIELEVLKKYHENRDFPAVNGTTQIGIHLRFGTVSIRKLVKLAQKHNETWLNQLIWRDFFMMILWHFPHVAQKSFKPKYDFVQWRNNQAEFEAWCKGETGFPLVDAAMRQLNQTGYMHNRLRMLTASFLVKHLLIDWRWGEAYFAERLLDFELASNNGGWQWAAGSGCDAAPYFRVFNPVLQHKKFDPQSQFVKKWLPEWEKGHYRPPIVEHKAARLRALDTFSKV